MPGSWDNLPVFWTTLVKNLHLIRTFVSKLLEKEEKEVIFSPVFLVNICIKTLQSMSLFKQVDVSVCQLVLRGAHKLWSSGKQVGGGVDFCVCQFPCCKYSHQSWFQATNGLKFILQNSCLSIHCLWQASTSWVKHASARHDMQAGSRWPSTEPDGRVRGPVTRRSRTPENDVKNTGTFSSLGCVASHALVEVLLHGHSATPLPEGTSRLLFFRKYYSPPYTVVVPAGAQENNSSHKESPKPTAFLNF